MGLADKDKNTATRCARSEMKSNRTERDESLKCGGSVGDRVCLTGTVTS